MARKTDKALKSTRAGDARAPDEAADQVKDLPQVGEDAGASTPDPLSTPAVAKPAEAVPALSPYRVTVHSLGTTLWGSPEDASTTVCVEATSDEDAVALARAEVDFDVAACAVYGPNGLHVIS